MLVNYAGIWSQNVDLNMAGYFHFTPCFKVYLEGENALTFQNEQVQWKLIEQ